MRLTELEPRWLHGDIGRGLFIFRCPCCRDMWLTCKNYPLKCSGQFELLQTAGIEGGRIVPAADSFSWTFNGSGFGDLTVSPSIDASNAKHWHGFIRAGLIT